MQIKILQAIDVAALESLIKEWQSSCNAEALDLPLPTVARITQTLNYLVNCKDCCVIGLVDDEKICGFMGGQAQDNHFCEIRMLTECFWFVSPKYRRYSKLLLLAMKEWGKSKGCSKMKISSSMVASADAEKVAKVLKIWGFAPYEFAFIGGL